MPKPVMGSRTRRCNTPTCHSPHSRAMTLRDELPRSASREDIARDEFLEGAGAVVHRELRGRRHLAEGLHHAVGDEDRVVAEAVAAARREDEMAVHLALEDPRRL